MTRAPTGDDGAAQRGPLLAVATVVVVGVVAMVAFANGMSIELAPLAVWGLLPLLLGGGLWLEARRRRHVREWAERVGWTYVGSDRTLVGRWRGDPFRTGSSRRTSEVVTGPWQGRQCVSFRYEYTTGSGKNRTTHTYHVVAMSLPAYLPTLELTPEGVGARIAKAFGGQDIQFESEDFNRAWRVRAADERFAHAVVHPRLMERLLRPDACRTSVRIEGTDVLTWAVGNPDLDALPRRLAVLAAVVDAVPDFVWQDHGHDPSRPRTDGPPHHPTG